MEVTAIAKNVSISPKKLRPLVATVRGKHVQDALAILSVMPTPAAGEVAKVIKSAMANAENNLQLDPDALRVARIMANGGLKLRRFMPQPRGRAGMVFKRHTHITVVLGEEEE